MHPYPTPPAHTRLGFHYFPDSLHYREKDLQTWLPELRGLAAGWLTLQAPPERAIPEFFLRELVSAGIEPVLHSSLPLDAPTPPGSQRLLYRMYARWGVHYLALFDRPNLRSAWPASAWAQTDLVERFLDRFLPLAEAAAAEGLIPLFPPLEPGGDYWDLAFLRSALRGMQRRGENRLLECLALGAYAWPGAHPLNWGAGGPERWPGTRPYFTPPGMQDQLGFRIFEWYQAVVRAELGASRPVLLLRAGSRPGDAPGFKTPEAATVLHARNNLALVRLMENDRQDLVGYIAPGPADGAVGKETSPVDTGEVQAGPDSHLEVLEPVPAEVMCCNFWLLADQAGSPTAAQAWYQPDGNPLPVVGALRQWNAARRRPRGAGEPVNGNGAVSARAESASLPPPDSLPAEARPISHYLLLPLYAWGAADWDLDHIRPYLQKIHPTVGFSLDEALLAERVTVLGGRRTLSVEALERLRLAGCQIEQMDENGTVLAI